MSEWSRAGSADGRRRTRGCRTWGKWRAALPVLALAAAAWAVPFASAQAKTLVEIEINQTAATDDDYVTWAPTFCRIRVIEPVGDIKVWLTNDPEWDFPDGGDVLFADYQRPWPVRTTATEKTLSLALPGSGRWVPFVIAGKFGKPSTEDKDAIIDVHWNTEDGPNIGRHELMVRVRKNANTLTVGERDRFLAALATLNFVQGGYAVHQQIHAIAGVEAHQGPAFLNWHRVFILRYERDLQAIDPSVSIPYWKFDDPAPAVFSQDWIGANNVGQGTILYAATNPIDGWSVLGVTPTRSTANHTVDPPGVQAEATTLGPATFTLFTVMEGNPHGSAHNWVGGSMSFLNAAVRDPVFFFLHSNVDRLWAKWQWLRDAFGTAPDDYFPTGTWPGLPGQNFHIGHYRDDTMWPWNGITGPHPSGNPTGNRPATAPGGPFPPAAPYLLGPPATPTPGDALDYLGFENPAVGFGFSFDDVPYA